MWVLYTSTYQYNRTYMDSIICHFVAMDDAIRKASGEEILIPFGVGIAGTVAQTKTMVNIKNAYEDPRFNSEIDQKTGYKTKNILSMPICNYEGDVIGVAQIINKKNGRFTCTTVLNCIAVHSYTKFRFYKMSTVSEPLF